MTLHLNWPPSVVDRLAEEARQKGLSDEAAKRQAREEAGRSIRELRRGNILGSDLTVRDLIEEGRRF